MSKTPPASTTPPASDAPSPTLAAAPAQRWIVKLGSGLIRVPADEAQRLVDIGRGRVPTARDLEIAGVTDI